MKNEIENNIETVILRKSKSRSHMEISKTSNDDWSVSMKRVLTKTNEVLKVSYIIPSDVEGWVIYLKNNGWQTNLTSTKIKPISEIGKRAKFEGKA